MSKFEVYQRLFRYNTYEQYKNFCFFNQIHRHHYKPFNCALLMAQRPGALIVNTEKAWNNRGYAVKPEAVPIVIMQMGGPVTFVYAREDVYSTSPHLVDMYDHEQEIPEKYNCAEVDSASLKEWINQIHRKGIRTAESRMGERMRGTAEKLKSPIKIVYSERSQDGYKDKKTDAYFQVTLNANLSDHNKALTILHELGHLYCGHVDGERNKTNSLPEFRFADECRIIQEMDNELIDIKNEIMNIEYSENTELMKDRYEALKKSYETKDEARGKFAEALTHKKEYEAEMVCNLLSIRNGFYNSFSEEYLESHTIDGKLPDVDLLAVFEAVEAIAGILDI